jgi:apbe-like lipoprotein precursor
MNFNKKVNMNNINKKFGKMGLIFLISVLIFSCFNNKEKVYTETVDGLFDTVHVISGYDKSEQEFKKKVKFYQEEMEKLHKLYTSYEDFQGINNISTINENAGIKPVKVDRNIIDLLKDTLERNKEISDKVNIAAGNVIDLWGKAKKEGKLPEQSELEKMQKCAKTENIVIDEQNSTVFIKEKCTKLNLGAVAKGYAVEQVTKKMEKAGMTSFIISAGGNVKVVGKRKIPKKESEITDLKSCKDQFCIGIALPLYNDNKIDKSNPYNNGKNDYLAKIATENMSIVTTGNYQRYFVMDNKVYGHVINLETLKPEDSFASVSVITEDSGLADFMSTTLFLLSYEEGKALIEKMGKKEKIDVIWAMKNGDVMSSEGLISGENYVKYNFR